MKRVMGLVLVTGLLAMLGGCVYPAYQRPGVVYDDGTRSAARTTTAATVTATATHRRITQPVTTIRGTTATAARGSAWVSTAATTVVITMGTAGIMVVTAATTVVRMARTVRMDLRRVATARITATD